MGQTQTVFLPPWIPSTEAETQHKQEYRDAIVKLSATASNFITPNAMHVHPEFNFDWVEHRPFAEAAYRADDRLFRLLPRLVPKRYDAPTRGDSLFCDSGALKYPHPGHRYNGHAQSAP